MLGELPPVVQDLWLPGPPWHPGPLLCDFFFFPFLFGQGKGSVWGKVRPVWCQCWAEDSSGPLCGQNLPQLD